MEYAYTARAKDGTIEKDVMSAFNEKAVVETLRAKGMMPTSVKSVSKGFDLNSLTAIFSSVKLLDKITFIKNLGVMIKSGLPVSRSLRILSEQTPNKKFGQIISEVSRAVESGNSLADSLAKHPNVFSSIFVSMVRVGEVSGNLEQNLHHLSGQLQRDYDLLSKAKGAMTYPVIVVIALMIVGVLMFTFVLPKLTSTFKEFDVELPIMTKIVIAVVDVFASYGVFILIGIVAAGVSFNFWRKTPGGKKIVHMIVLSLPILGNVVKKINQARFLSVFSSLLKSGMPIVEALDVSAQVVGNLYYQNAIKEASGKVKVGNPLAAHFKKNGKLFAPLVIQMMEVGEESGTTDTVLDEVSLFYEGEVDQTMKNLSSILEPVIMMIVGVVVGILALALISPIYSITQSV